MLIQAEMHAFIPDWPLSVSVHEVSGVRQQLDADHHPGARKVRRRNNLSGRNIATSAAGEDFGQSNCPSWSDVNIPHAYLIFLSRSDWLFVTYSRVKDTNTCR